MSHELKTPLTSLILIGERLESVVSKKDRYLVKRLKKESKRLRKMVEETLELSKLESSEAFNKNKKMEPTKKHVTPFFKKNKQQICSHHCFFSS